MNKILIVHLVLILINMEAQSQTKNMETASLNPRTFTCKLTSPELQERKKTIISELKTLIKIKKEISNGFAYKFSGEDEMLDKLTLFIKTEKKCCSFFDFTLEIEGTEEGFIWLSITGPEGVKDFIKEDLDL